MAVLYNSVHFTLLILLLCAKVDDQISWAWGKIRDQCIYTLVLYKKLNIMQGGGFHPLSVLNALIWGI